MSTRSPTRLVGQTTLVVRAAILAAVGAFVLWLLNANVGLGTDFYYTLRDFTSPHPFFKALRVDGVLSYPDETGAQRFRILPEEFRFTVRAPRSYATVTLDLELTARDVPTAWLEVPAPYGRPGQGFLLWDSNLGTLGWQRMDDSGVTLLQRPPDTGATHPTFPNIGAFLAAAGQRDDVGSAFSDRLDGRQLDSLQPPSLEGINYVLVPTPRRDAPTDHATFSVSLPTSEVGNRNRQYTFAIRTPGTDGLSRYLELRSLHVRFRGDSLLRKVWTAIN